MPDTIHEEGVCAHEHCACHQQNQNQGTSLEPPSLVTAAAAAPEETTEQEQEPTFTCSCCSEECTGESHTVDDADESQVCQSCRDEHYVECERRRCPRIVHRNNTTEVSGDRWCPECVADHSFICDDCAERCSCDRSNFATAHGDTVCGSCYEDSYFTCSSCDHVFHLDHCVTVRDENYCEECAPNEEDGPIQDYGHYWPKGRLGAGPHYYGVELEVECPHQNPGDRAQACLNLLNRQHPEFAIAKHDGSLDRGFELVTCPATLEEQKKHWDPFFKALPGGIESFKHSTTGLHVHCSRRPLSNLQVAKIVCFVNALHNRKFIEAIAGRPSCAPAKMKPIEKMGKATACYQEDRYEAVNLQNDRTIEFRIFKGTLKRESVYKAMEFCDALIRFTAPAETDIHTSLSSRKFIEHVKSKKKQWPHLYAFIMCAWFGVSTNTELGFKVLRRAPADWEQEGGI